jgi:hypothetical protein
MALDMGWTLDKQDQFAALASILGMGAAAARAPWNLVAPPSADHAGLLDLHSDGMESWRDPPLDGQVWKRSVSSGSREAPFMLLSPEDRLVYLCWHFVADGLPWPKLYEIEHILRHGESLDWALIASRARETGMLTVVHLVCRSAAERAGEPLAPYWRSRLPVVASIRQRLLQRLIDRIDRRLDERRRIMFSTLTYDRASLILAAARAALVPGPVELARLGVGMDSRPVHRFVALARAYASRLKH